MSLENEPLRQGALWTPIQNPQLRASNFDWDLYLRQLIYRDLLFFNLGGIILLCGAAFMGRRAMEEISNQNSSKVYTNLTTSKLEIFGRALLAITLGLVGIAILKSTCTRAIQVGRFERIIL